MKPGDLVIVRVVGLGALRRTWHDRPAVVLEVKDGPRPGHRIAHILWGDRTQWISVDLLKVIEAQNA